MGEERTFSVLLSKIGHDEELELFSIVMVLQVAKMSCHDDRIDDVYAVTLDYIPMRYEFLASPDLHQKVQACESTGGGGAQSLATRRSFLKRTGGATVAAMVAWNIAQEQAQGATIIIGSSIWVLGDGALPPSSSNPPPSSPPASNPPPSSQHKHDKKRKVQEVRANGQVVRRWECSCGVIWTETTNE